MMKLHKIFDCVEFWVDLSRALDFFSHFNLELRNEREKKSTAQENGDKMVTKLRQKIDKKIVLSVCLSKWTNYWNDFHGKNKSRIHFRGIFLTEQFLTRAFGPEVVENCGKVLINGLLHRVPGDILYLGK